MGAIKAALIVICVVALVSGQPAVTSVGTIPSVGTTNVTYQPNYPDYTTTVQTTTLQPVYGQQPQTPQLPLLPSPSPNNQLPLSTQNQWNSSQSASQLNPTFSPQLFQFVGMIQPFGPNRLQPDAQSLFWNVQPQSNPFNRPNRIRPQDFGGFGNMTGVGNLSDQFSAQMQPFDIRFLNQTQIDVDNFIRNRSNMGNTSNLTMASGSGDQFKYAYTSQIANATRNWTFLVKANDNNNQSQSGVYQQSANNYTIVGIDFS
jgi:hypothetical protein